MVNKDCAVVHFSCGVTSAIAGLLALKAFKHVEMVYADPVAEHPDNLRFLHDCERLYKRPITIVRSEKFGTIFDVFKKRKFLASPAGAPCTTEMKKLPLRDYLGSRLMSEVQVFGYDAGEEKRAARFRKNNPELTLDFPLLDRHVTKEACLYAFSRSSIKLPLMYALGYEHSNCMGCVKAENLGYWAAIKEDFPEVFAWYAKFEREIGAKVDGKPKGAAINKRYIKGVRTQVFLDSFPSDIKPRRKLSIACGYSCGVQESS